MGLFDFEEDWNPIQMGAAILANNSGHYGAFGPAIGGGMQDYGRMQQAAAQQAWLKQQRQQQQLQWQQARAQSERLKKVRDQFPDNQYAQLDPAGYLKNQAQMKATQAATDAERKWQLWLEGQKSNMGVDAKRQELMMQHNLKQYGTTDGPGGAPATSTAPMGSTTPGAQPQAAPVPAAAPAVGGNLSFEGRQDVEKSAVEKQMELQNKMEEERVKGQQNAYNTLSSNALGRQSALKKAYKFLNAFQGKDASGNDVAPMSSGAGRQFAMDWIPGVWSTQGEFDEEFNAFAETAARQKLKQAGETRPTDSDVEGMKRAMFGVGRDEQVNINLLQEFIAELEAEEQKYMQLKPQYGRRDIDDLINRYRTK